MNNKSFVTAEQLAAMLNVSKGHAYKAIHNLNEELKKQGLTFSGRIPLRYLEERCYRLKEKVGVE